ncbi:TetR/AcrR family transcriptional regulator [Mucilaginibacter sp. KACC 22773]|uniref:TetR/AcrR family transcriptional regulator n=1 Tax=Mucilaginibacter sp. KACC 22773 TaxID=3025671 RepID=UPI0023655A80|nr:TetR/AcrR family transcriptional regulator [Mucilaginibacter sp. KACC 22773]WDF77116.1 TetR/AcrR family transcriptional regulator [Mucilaginibacter sp. KACC 22773]
MRNRELTKRKLIDAVGEIFRKEGHTGLGVNKVAKQAGVTKKLIYDYFERDFDNLVEAYILETDYWMAFADRVQELIDQRSYNDNQKLITDILQNQFRYFFLDKQMQKLILWEVSTNSPLMRSIHNARESMGQKLFELTDQHFANSGVNFRAVSALLVGGIYYTILHTRFNGGVFSDIDIATEEGRNEMLKAIEMIVSWAYHAGNANEGQQNS